MRLVGSCRARCAQTGRRCDLPAHPDIAHRYGRTTFYELAREGQEYFPKAVEIAAAAFAHSEPSIEEYGDAHERRRARDSGRLEETDRQERRDFQRRCVVCGKRFVERASIPQRTCCSRSCGIRVIKSGLTPEAWTRKTGFNPNAEQKEAAHAQEG